MHPAVVGREAELASARSFVSGDGPERALALVGEPGIGKTTLWEATLAAAEVAGIQVLVTRASEPELQLSYAALSDLFEDIDVATVDGVPPPQLRALEIALLRAAPDGAPPEPLSVAAGFTRVLRGLSERGRVLVAIDDVAWLDRASKDTLAFAARRLGRREVRFLLTRRVGSPSQLEHAFSPTGLKRLDVGALSFGAVRSLLSERLSLHPPRRVLLRLFELSQGSPLVALELGRGLVEQGLPDVGNELPLPELVDELFSHRVGSLTPPIRRALLAVAVTGGLTRLDLASLVGPLVVDDAIAAGVLVRDGSRVRASHPLVGAAARRLSAAPERHDLHLQLASVLSDETMRARHLALAASVADDKLADRIATAGEKALARGAIHDAVELAEHALRLTTPDSALYEERMFTLLRHLKVAGETARVRELLEARVAGLAPGAARARAFLTLSDSGERLSEMEAYVDAALAECGNDPELRSAALAMKALIYGIVRLEKLDLAEAWARESLLLARTVGLEAQRRSVHALAWIDVMRGRPLERLGADLIRLPEGSSLYESAIERPAGIRAMVRGNLDESRAVFERLRSLAGERGEALSASIMHRQLCEIELRAGDTRAAERHLDQWGEWTLPDDAHEQVVGPARCRALLAVIKGDPAQATSWATRAIEAAQAIENFREETEGRRALGVAALFARDHERAVEQLQPLWRHAERELIGDPGVFPVAPDLVESLVQLGELGEARAVAEELERAAGEQAHPWGLAGAKRCRALIQLGSGNVDAAETDLTEAAGDYARLGLMFDAARTLLILGRAQRRRKKWGAAREALDKSIAIFVGLGAGGWADEARGELSRLGARRPTPRGALSATEREVAERAVRGLSNKTIAAELHVTVNTVEKHLSHVYAKLGVHSRGQLAHHLPSSD